MMYLRLFCLSLTFLAVFPAFAADEKAPVTYADAEINNVSELLFAKGILKTSDPAAIEEYIRIHHCGIYEQYSRDDFSWARIREAQARTLELALPDLPQGIRVVSSLALDQYDMTTNSFLIKPAQQMDAAGSILAMRLEMGNINPCPDIQFSSFVPRVHPLSLMVKLEKPVTLKGLSMKRDTADALIAAMNKSGNLKRNVVLTMDIRITGVDPLAMTDPLRRSVLGKLDYIRVYDGLDRKNLIFKKDFENPTDSKGTN